MERPLVSQAAFSAAASQSPGPEGRASIWPAVPPHTAAAAAAAASRIACSLRSTPRTVTSCKFRPQRARAPVSGAAREATLDGRRIAKPSGSRDRARSSCPFGAAKATAARAHSPAPSGAPPARGYAATPSYLCVCVCVCATVGARRASVEWRTAHGEFTRHSGTRDSRLERYGGL